MSPNEIAGTLNATSVVSFEPSYVNGVFSQL